jgi:hypothetical protein
MKRITFGIGLVAAVQLLAAQSAALPAFDAASVKIDNSAFTPAVSGRAHGGPGTDDPGRFTYTQTRLKYLVMLAYGVMADQTLGPAWLDDVQGESITITATMPPDTSKEQFQVTRVGSRSSSTIASLLTGAFQNGASTTCTKCAAKRRKALYGHQLLTRRLSCLPTSSGVTRCAHRGIRPRALRLARRRNYSPCGI